MLEPNALTGAEIDRVADSRRRDPEWLAAQTGHPDARALVLGDAGVRVVGTALARVPLTEVRPDVADEELVLLGVDDGGPLFVVDEDPPVDGERAPLVGAGGMRGEPAPEAEERLGMRSAAQTLSQAEGGLVAYAGALLNWHRAHRFCSVCGGATAPREAGMTRVCGVCGTHHHPRTDPVVIMLVVDDEGDRVLLGRQAVWPPRRYSTLAGFVSPGESLEEAVAREVLEEVGVLVGPPRYRSSQPWPFPCSLMLGFHVPYVEGEIGGTDDELQDARWFSRAEVREAAADDSWDDPPEGDGLLLPPRSAIARRLIEEWLEG
ncbi:NAD(+) diphosphatase [Patulibacter minatonensis]|uniref:NAD(+) diphosphatase n=1 Tax=Patulibacter minatonensis TaxID=298163 RepID=UPI000479ED45|nr:NAD(+) diphosphatase [Patulibacter minatonensis]